MISILLIRAIVFTRVLQNCIFLGKVVLPRANEIIWPMGCSVISFVPRFDLV